MHHFALLTGSEQLLPLAGTSTIAAVSPVAKAVGGQAGVAVCVCVCVGGYGCVCVCVCVCVCRWVGVISHVHVGSNVRRKLLKSLLIMGRQPSLDHLPPVMKIPKHCI